MRLLFATLLLLVPSTLFAQGDCNDDYHPCRGLLVAEHPLLPVGGIPGGVPDGDTWADTSGLLFPGTTGLLIQVEDPGNPEDPEFPSDPNMGCAPLTNGDEVASHIAFMERGGCQFGLKALHAQEAGAIGFVIRDHFGSIISDELDPPLYMYGGTYGMQVHIPGIIIHYYDGLDLVEILEDEDLSVTLRYRDPAPVGAEDDLAPPPSVVSAPFPNPFGSRTRFTLTLDRTQHVTVAVFDVLGRRAATLYDGVLSAGTSTVTLEARALPQGVYFVRFEGDTFSGTRRVVLNR